jgi:S-adenosylmethionine hydrolase
MAYITLLSDLGLQDASVAIAKGILSHYSGDNNIIDISHEVTPFHTGQAAYFLSIACSNFPAGSCHIVLSDIFSEPEPKVIVSVVNEQYFISADNGIVPLALGKENVRSTIISHLKKDEGFDKFVEECGKMLINLPASGKTLPMNHIPKSAAAHYLPVIDRNFIECDVIHIDRYENVVINVTRQQFENTRLGRMFSLQFMEVEEITEISQNYNDVKTGYKLCRFNNNDYLEICINRGKAASLFGLRLGSRHNGLKITFE